MKIKTINRIEEMLRQQKESEYISYKRINDRLKQKYGSEWRTCDITPDEETILKSQRECCKIADEFYEDFINHNWK